MTNISADLSFRPVENSGAAVLSQDQIHHYNEHGFVAPFRVYDDTGVEANRLYFDSLLEQVADRGSYAINCYQARCQGIWDLCTNANILD